MRLLAAHGATIRRWTMMLALTAAVAGVTTACGGTEPADGPEEAAPIENPVDPATAGRISGRITFTGRAPEPQPVKTESDPRCTAPVTTEEVVLGEDGSLQNVFVYVKDGLGDLVFPVPTEPVVLGQEGCMYRPRVLGIQVVQTLEILNGDATLHNIHAIPEHNAEFNKAQTGEGARNTHVFSTEEVLVPFKCDVHRWMNAYVGVVRHPFHAVTGSDGTFSLDGLPPGTYTIEAVHETRGRQTQTVTLEASGTQELAFTFPG
jgi:plastocyanin